VRQPPGRGIEAPRRTPRRRAGSLVAWTSIEAGPEGGAIGILPQSMPALALAIPAAVLGTAALADTAVAATVTLTPASPRPGASAHLHGSGFAARTTGTVRLGSTGRRVRTDGDGQLTAVLPVSGTAGRRRLVVRVAGRRVAATVTVAAGGRDATALVAQSGGPRLVVDPTRAPPGAAVRVRGAGFGAQSRVALRLTARRLAVSPEEVGSLVEASDWGLVAEG
jgi:hypothetical protein